MSEKKNPEYLNGYREGYIRATVQVWNVIINIMPKSVSTSVIIETHKILEKHLELCNEYLTDEKIQEILEVDKEQMRKFLESIEKLKKEAKNNEELKDKVYDKWIECYNDCYNKSSYYNTKCGLCSFKKFCEIKYKGSE